MPSTTYPSGPSVYREPGHPYWTAPRRRWLIADETTDAEYPCECSVASRCDPARCHCSGRIDHLDLMPDHCCARRTAETSARALDVRRTGER